MIDTVALREKVLDLAIRGKLVPQDPNDEPASVLLERIREQKQQMVKEGKLKAKDIKDDSVIFVGEDNLHYEKFADGTVKCIEDEIPYELPEGWSWSRFRVFCPYGDCEKYETSAISDDSWILDLEDIEKNTGRILAYVTKSERNAVSTKHKFYKGQVLYSKLRPYLNKVVIAPKDGYCTSEILPLKLYDQILPKYVQLFLMSGTFLSYVNMISYGVKMPRLGTEDGKKALIALPPLQEQVRIAEKYDYIIPMISELQINSEELSSSITTIKSKILELAIRGKLVPQDPNDEPASVLLERIRAEKEELIKQGKIKRDKKESIIFKGEDNSYYEKFANGDIKNIDSEIPFELPLSWEWCKIGDLFTHNTGKALNSADINGTTMTYITTSNLYWDSFVLDSLKKMNFSDSEIEKCTVRKGDLLVCEGGDIGRAAIWQKDEEIRIQNHIHKLRPYIQLSNRFYYYVFYLWKQMDRIGGRGIGLQGFSSKALHNLLVPLPPIREQIDIVTQVDAIWKMLDSIEKSLN